MFAPDNQTRFTPTMDGFKDDLQVAVSKGQVNFVNVQQLETQNDRYV